MDVTFYEQAVSRCSNNVPGYDPSYVESSLKSTKTPDADKNTSEQNVVCQHTNLIMALRSAVNTVAKRVALATAAQVCPFY